MRPAVRPALRWVGGVALLAAGLATGVAGTAVHETGWGLPWLAVSVLGLLAWTGPGWLTRLPFAVGFAGVVGLATWPRPEGDYLVGSSVRGLVLLGLAGVVLVGSIVTLPRPGPDRGRGSP